MTRTLPGLDPGERLRVWTSMSFRGATAASSRATFALSSGRSRMRSYLAWEEIANAAGFPTAGPDVVLGVTDERLGVWRTSFGLGRPVELAGSVPLERIAQVTTPRLGIVTGLVIVLTNGALVQFEAMRARRVRTLGAELKAAVAARGPGA